MESTVWSLWRFVSLWQHPQGPPGGGVQLGFLPRLNNIPFHVSTVSSFLSSVHRHTLAAVSPPLPGPCRAWAELSVTRLEGGGPSSPTSCRPGCSRGSVDALARHLLIFKASNYVAGPSYAFSGSHLLLCLVSPTSSCRGSLLSRTHEIRQEHPDSPGGSHVTLGCRDPLLCHVRSPRSQVSAHGHLWGPPCPPCLKAHTLSGIGHLSC